MEEELIIQPTRNSQLSWYVRHKAQMNAYNAARRWHCKGCDFECAAAYKMTHLKGAAHKAVIAARDGTPAPAVCNNHKHCWDESFFEVCKACNCKLLKKGRTVHMRTKKHLKNVEKAEKAEKAEKEVEPASLD